VLFIVILSVIYAECHYAKCHYAQSFGAKQKALDLVSAFLSAVKMLKPAVICQNYEVFLSLQGK